ncbi:MAG: hypothetical protein CVV34_07270 [Methanomicrobiales archaeon HGW-Methanomicrobiales-5]|nr:MAG: hypothetical protein CVV34_07270 [Methanomicrobiales archaeon HGW-Methanomicrobiales-5]
MGFLKKCVKVYGFLHIFRKWTLRNGKPGLMRTQIGGGFHRDLGGGISNGVEVLTLVCVLS